MQRLSMLVGFLMLALSAVMPPAFAADTVVALHIRPTTEMVFPLATAIKGSDQAVDLQVKFIDALQKQPLLAYAKTRVVVKEESVTVRTQAETLKEAQNELNAVRQVMEKLVGKGKFTVPDAEAIFHPETPEIAQDICEILARRFTAAGYKDITVTAKETDVLVTLPNEFDDNIARLLQPGLLEFRLLPADITADNEDKNSTTLLRNGKKVTPESVYPSTLFVADGSMLKPTSVVFERKKPAIAFTMATKADREHFGNVTANNIGRHLAIFFDGKLITAPIIRDRIDGNGIIAGSFTEGKVEELCAILNSGALPAPIVYLDPRLDMTVVGEK